MIARNHGLAKARFVDAAEKKKFFVAFRNVAQKKHGGALRHRFDDQHARHHRRAGKMSLKKLLVRRHVFQSDDARPRIELEDPIDEQHRIAMRQQFENVLNGQHVYDFFLVSRRNVASRRANSRNGTAGIPITFVSSGTSSSTALFAAT